MIKDKGATLQSTIFVILTLALVVSIVFVFISSYSKSSSKMSSFDVYDDAYYQKTNLEYFLKQVVAVSLIEAYKKTADAGQYIKTPVIIDKSGNYVFSGFSKNLEEVFEKNFNESLKENINLIDFNGEGEDYMNEFRRTIDSGNYRVNFDGEKISVFISNLSLHIKNSDENIEVLYKPFINISVELNKLGLNNFNEIYTFKEICSSRKNIGDKKECYLSSRENLDKFNVDVHVLGDSSKKRGQKILIILESKKSFLIKTGDGLNFKKISFRFVV